MHTWANQLELIRLFLAHQPFRKALAMGLVDLARGHLDRPPSIANKALHKMARWLAHITHKFTANLPLQEVYNTLKEVPGEPPMGLEAIRKSLIQDGKFWKVFAVYLDANKAQFSAPVLLFQTLTIGLWDTLIVIKSSTLPSSSSSWIQTRGEYLDQLASPSISIPGQLNQVSPHKQDEQIKLKNIILRLATGVDFLNWESALIFKSRPFSCPQNPLFF
ncbi:hypothetical protein PtA15_10A254 [Puccinia triticina]|uniref:Telomere-associated protein Rif1 N-terminal domain-containing protein n=1 Tax=Puccinia triticina TaxID=208348 RepID=A0ABY7CU99_9BASI|nr:uncharacterized protein PtA15_10A254 [Puccinia triticina]WAQ88834.1 hypothetical protein PtA15_10A254 [Puccinia triticina]